MIPYSMSRRTQAQRTYASANAPFIAYHPYRTRIPPPPAPVVKWAPPTKRSRPVVQVPPFIAILDTPPEVLHQQSVDAALAAATQRAKAEMNRDTALRHRAGVAALSQRVKDAVGRGKGRGGPFSVPGGGMVCFTVPEPVEGGIGRGGTGTGTGKEVEKEWWRVEEGERSPYSRYYGRV